MSFSLYVCCEDFCNTSFLDAIHGIRPHILLISTLKKIKNKEKKGHPNEKF